MAVTVSRRSLEDAWARGWEHERGEMIQVRLRLADAVDSQWPSRLALPAVQELLTSVHDECLTRADLEVPPTVGRPVLIAPDAIGVGLGAGREEEVAALLDALTPRLASSDLTGSLDLLPERPTRVEELPGARRPETLALVLAMRRDPAPAGGERQPVRSESLRSRLTSLVDDVVPAQVSRCQQWASGVSSDVRREWVANLCGSALGGPPGSIKYVASAPSTFRAVDISSWDLVILHSRADPTAHGDDLAELLALGRRWAPECAYVGLTTTVMPLPSLRATFAQPFARRSRLPREVATRRVGVPLLPDVFPWSILRSAHLGRVGDLVDWHAEPIDPDQYEVAPRETRSPGGFSAESLHSALREPSRWVPSATELTPLLHL